MNLTKSVKLVFPGSGSSHDHPAVNNHSVNIHSTEKIMLPLNSNQANDGSLTYHQCEHSNLEINDGMNDYFNQQQTPPEVDVCRRLDRPPDGYMDVTGGQSLIAPQLSMSESYMDVKDPDKKDSGFGDEEKDTAQFAHPFAAQDAHLFSKMSCTHQENQSPTGSSLSIRL